MPATISSNTPSKGSISADKRAEKKAHDIVVSRDLRDLDYANKTLAEDLISSYMKGDASFNGHRSVLIRRLKYLLIRYNDPRSLNETVHMASQFIMLDRVRQSVGISLKEIDPYYYPSGNGTEVKQSTDIYKNPSILRPSGLPNALVELLKTPSSSGMNYHKYVKNNVERVVFADFTGTGELKKIDASGISEPISRTAIINTITYYGYSVEKVRASLWALASQLVHETAHIEWDREQNAGPDTNTDDFVDRYACIREYNFLNDLMSNVENRNLEKHANNIKLTIKEVERRINKLNYKLGYMNGDFSLKISSK